VVYLVQTAVQTVQTGNSVPNILAIEASADACSVALQTAKGIIERNEFTPRQHTLRYRRLMPSHFPQAQVHLPDCGLRWALRRGLLMAPIFR